MYCFALLALGLAFVAPNHYPPWTSFHNEALAFLAVALAGAGLVMGARQKRYPVTPVLWIALALVSLVWVQWAAGLVGYAGDAAVISLYLAFSCVALALGQAHATAPCFKQHALKALALVVLAAATLSVFIALLQWLRLEEVMGIFAMPRVPEMRPFGNLAQPNHLATLLLTALALLVYLHAEAKISSGLALGLVVLLSFGLLMTESRAGTLSAAAIVMVLLFKGKKLGNRLRVGFLVLWLVSLGAGGTLWQSLNEALLLQPPRGAAVLRDQARIVMWRQAADAAMDSPWVGYGWRQSGAAQKEIALSVPGDLQADYAHNIILDAVLWNGIPLGLLLVGSAAVWWYLRYRAAATGEAVFALAATVPFIVHSFFEFPFAYAYFLFPAAYFAGFAGVSAGTEDASPGAFSVSRIPFLGAALLLLSLGTVVVREYLEVEEDFRVMRFEVLRVGRQPKGYEAPQIAVLNQLREMLQAGRIAPRPGMPEQEIAALRRITRRFVWLPLQFKLAVSLALNGRSEEAVHEMSVLRALFGPLAYRQVRESLKVMEREQFPALGRVGWP